MSTADYHFDPTYGYTLQQLLAVTPPREPKDFEAFWQQRYRHALTVNPAPHTQIVNENRLGYRVFNIGYTSTNQFPIRGRLLIPISGVVKRGFILGHGYGYDALDEPDFQLFFKDAAFLLPCFRGLALSAQPAISAEPYWHVLHGIEQREHYILGGCVEDVWLAVSTLLSLFPQTAGHIGYMGISFGAGIGAIALAYEQRIARGHVNVPSFGHHLIRLRLPSVGSADSVQKYYKTHKKQTLKVLRFYDAAIAAKRITMPMHCACALFDPFVAPPGQFAVYNALPGEKQLFVLEAGHHEYPNKAKQTGELLQALDDFFAPLSK